MRKQKLSKSSKKIIAATVLALFPLIPAAVGTWAWFANATAAETTVQNFSVVSLGDAAFRSASLIKFVYDSRTYGSGQSAMTVVDYLNPATGTVMNYDYNALSSQFEDESHNKVDAMNVYDPVDYLINGEDLLSMNCNAIYRFDIESSSFLDCYLNATVSKIDGVDDEEGEKILLSSCLDFDLFFEDDLDDDNPLFFVSDNPKTASANEYDEKAYYPSYKISKNEQFYQYDAGLSAWGHTAVAPSGTNKGSVLYEEYLPLPPSDGDYFLVGKKATAYNAYFQWNGSSWGKSAEPGPGANKGSIDFDCDLPTTGNTNLDYYLVAYETTSSGKYFQWDESGARYVETVEEPSGRDRGSLAYDISLPATDGYYKVLSTRPALSEEEEIYYKFSYLSSLKASHANLYSGVSSDRKLATNEAAAFAYDALADKNAITIYVNANYSPSELDAYSTQIYGRDFEAVYDFAFRFEFSAGEVI